MSLSVGNTITSVIWTRSVQGSDGAWHDEAYPSPIVLPQGTWLVVWNIVNLYQGNWQTPPPTTGLPPSRPLYFAAAGGITIDSTILPAGVRILSGPPLPDQTNVTQWTVLFAVDTDAPTSFQYDILLVDTAGNAASPVIQIDPTILVEEDPISPP